MKQTIRIKDYNAFQSEIDKFFNYCLDQIEITKSSKEKKKWIHIIDVLIQNYKLDLIHTENMLCKLADFYYYAYKILHNNHAYIKYKIAIDELDCIYRKQIINPYI